MLHIEQTILAQGIGESIQIGEDVELKILGASPSRVMVGIAAPRALKILRIAASPTDDAHAEPQLTGKRAANETIRQRRPKVTSR